MENDFRGSWMVSGERGELCLFPSGQIRLFLAVSLLMNSESSEDQLKMWEEGGEGRGGEREGEGGRDRGGGEKGEGGERRKRKRDQEEHMWKQLLSLFLSLSHIWQSKRQISLPKSLDIFLVPFQLSRYSWPADGLIFLVSLSLRGSNDSAIRWSLL